MGGRGVMVEEGWCERGGVGGTEGGGEGGGGVKFSCWYLC